MLTKAKKEQLVEDFEKWWEHKLERPIIQVTLFDEDYQPQKHRYNRGELLEMLYDLDKPVNEVVQAYQETFFSNIYLGDAFPIFYMRSTGVLGAYLGQTYHIDVKQGTIWFQEMKGCELEDIHPRLEETYPLYQRSLELIKPFNQFYGDDIAMGIANLGGMMDIVESMRGANNSLIDLYDDPDEVQRLNDDIYKAFEQAYEEMIASIDLNNTLGYTGWISLLSQKPYFISQCDFCCMIGPEQFDEFVFETLKKEASLIERSFYHLDGPGAVRHLDKIIECGFKGIQWINGAGAKPLNDPCWNEIYQKVHDAGLLLQVNISGKEELEYIDYIVDYLGSPKGIAFICTGSSKDKEVFEAYLEKYHIPN